MDELREEDILPFAGNPQAEDVVRVRGSCHSRVDSFDVAHEGRLVVKGEGQRQRRGEHKAPQGGVEEGEVREVDGEDRVEVELEVEVVGVAVVDGAADAVAAVDPGSLLHTEDIDAMGRKRPADGEEAGAVVVVVVAEVVHATLQRDASGDGPLEVQDHHMDRAVWTCRGWPSRPLLCLYFYQVPGHLLPSVAGLIRVKITTHRSIAVCGMTGMGYAFLIHEGKSVCDGLGIEEKRRE